MQKSKFPHWLILFIFIAISCGYSGTPLHQAVYDGDFDRVKKLISEGVDVNILDENGETPLVQALYVREYDIAEYLVSQGGTIDLVNKHGRNCRDKFYYTKKDGSLEDPERAQWIDENIGEKK